MFLTGVNESASVQKKKEFNKWNCAAIFDNNHHIFFVFVGLYYNYRCL